MLKKAGKFLIPFVVPTLALALPFSAYAANLVAETPIAGITDIMAIIKAVIRFILVVAFIAAFIMLLIGGIRWITAGGDEKGVAGARNMITGALIGLVVVLVAYAIIKLVETFFGVTIISGETCIPNVAGGCTS